MSDEIYLDSNATNPLEPAILEAMLPFFTHEIGNASSQSHSHGARAKQAVEAARRQIAALVDASAGDVVFTSGATEANNLAILGLAASLPQGNVKGKRPHIITSAIEHKSVLDPALRLQNQGFDVELLSPNPGGWVEADTLANALREETLLVSLMHVNNETGVIQPIDAYADILADHPAYLHVDACQGFGRELTMPRLQRIDLMSINAHKIFGPRGIGALITRPRRYDYPPITPLFFGGSQERGLRPGTPPVPLIVGFGEAARMALADHAPRHDAMIAMGKLAREAFIPLNPTIHGDPERVLPHVLNLSFPGVSAQSLFLVLKGIAAFSNGAACSSGATTDSHVLRAMGIDPDTCRGAVRFSWSHLTPSPPWQLMSAKIKDLT